MSKDQSIGLKRNTVKLITYSTKWSAYALMAIKELRSILKDILLGIEHIGSTAIIDMDAKPIIDIVVGVRELKDVKKYYEKLQEKGYVHIKEDDNKDQIFFSCGDFKKDIRTHHIHFVVHNSKIWNEYIDFRDIMNNYEDKRNEYKKLKKRLSEKYFNDRVNYTKNKNRFIKDILSSHRSN